MPYTHVKKEIRRYARWSDIFFECSYKTFDDSDKKASKNNYIKQSDRSDHKWAFTYQEMMRVVTMFFDVMMEELIQGNKVYTPIGLFNIRRLKRDTKENLMYKMTKKMFRQINVLGYKFILYATGNRFKNRSVCRIVFHRMFAPKLYDRLEKESSLIYKYPEE